MRLVFLRLILRVVLTGRTAVITLLPNPPIFNRRAPVPYYLKITASHPGALDNFPLGIIDVVIFQRVTLVASGVTGVHEVCLAPCDSLFDRPAEGLAAGQNPIGRGTTMPDGGRDGIIATRHEWTKKLKGDIKLDAGAVPNFVCPNITVEVRRASSLASCVEQMADWVVDGLVLFRGYSQVQQWERDPMRAARQSTHVSYLCSISPQNAERSACA